jgi:hypothetical protein
MIATQMPYFMLLLGDKSIELFDYFKVDELHSLLRSDCEQCIDTETNAFIRGMCNYYPDTDTKEKYLFFNMLRYKQGEYQSHSAVGHEVFHLVEMLRADGQIKTEESAAMAIERITNSILSICEAFTLQKPPIVFE